MNDYRAALPILNEYIAKKLQHLPYDAKAKFIAALFSNDEHTILNFVNKIPLYAPDQTSLLDEEEKQATLKALIKKWQIKKYTPTTSLTRAIDLICQSPHETLDEPDQRRKYLLLEYAFCSIPDTQMTTAQKRKICGHFHFSHKTEAYDKMNYGYTKPLEPLEENKYPGDIDFPKYKTAIATTKLDISDFILLTLGVLQSECKKNGDTPQLTNEKLNSIRELFYFRNYEQAINEIREFCKNSIGSKNKEISATILKRSYSKFPEPTLDKNDSRRFYENRIVELYIAQPIDWVSLNRIASRIADFDCKDMASIHPIQHMRDILTTVTEFHKHALYYKDKQLSLVKFSNRKKIYKAGFFSQLEEIKETDFEKSYSRNRGVMTSTQKNFPLEISSQVQVNRTPDKYMTKGIEGDDKFHSRSVYAGNYSGHAFAIATILEDYLEEFPDDISINTQDINNLIKAILCAFVSRGSHSFFEMIDMFNEIKIIFDRYKIILDFRWAKEILSMASQDAQQYAQVNCTLNAMQEEMDAAPSPFPLHRSIEKGQTDRVKFLLETKINVNERRWDGNTPLDLAVDENKPVIVSMLLNHPDIKPDELHKNGMTSFHMAVQNGQVEIVKIFLQSKKMDPAKLTRHRKSAISIAINNRNLDVINLFLEKNIIDKSNLEPLLFFEVACKFDRQDWIDLVMQNAKIATLKNNLNQTALLIAAQYGNLSAVNKVLKCNSDVRYINQLDSTGETALSNMLYNLFKTEEFVKPIDKYLNVAATLLECKADVNLGISTPVIYAIIAANDIRLFHLFLNHPLLNMNVRGPSNCNILHVAVSEGRTQIVELLLKTSKFLLYEKDSDGLTPIHLAITTGSIEIVELLLREDKDDIATNMLTNNGESVTDLTADDDVTILSLLRLKKIKPEDLEELKLITAEFIKRPVYSRIMLSPEPVSVKMMRIIGFLYADFKQQQTKIDKKYLYTSPAIFSRSFDDDQVKRCARLYQALLKIEENFYRFKFIEKVSPIIHSNISSENEYKSSPKI